MRESFVFYKTFYEAIKNVPDEVEQAKAYKYIFEYVFEGIEPTENDFARALFCVIKVNIDNSLARYKASVENGKKGGRPKKEETQKKPNNNLDKTQKKPSVNLNDNVNDNLNVNDNNKYFSNEKLNELFLDFLQMRKKLKAVNSERAINALLKTLSNYDDDTKYKMIENSITNSWKGIFPLKEQKPAYKPQRVEQVPSWINTNIDENEATEEEQKALDDLLNSTEDFETRKAKLQERLRQKYAKGGKA